MDTKGSIRASLKGSKTGFHPQSIEPAVLERAKQFLESLQFDLRIRQVLHSDKLEISLSKHTYYVLGNEQRYEPGYIIIMKGYPPMFIHGRFQFGFSLRLRLHQSIYDKEAIFIGTLDTIHAQLRIEDVLYYMGKSVNRDPFSKRYPILHTFLSDMFIQDKHLSGLNVSVAEVYALSTLRDHVERGEFNSIDLIPEQGGRRRWHIPLHNNNNNERKKKQESVSHSKKIQNLQEELENTKINTSTQSLSRTNSDTSIGTNIINNIKYTQAIAYKIIGLPDTYDLRDTSGNIIGRAAVQNANVSVALRKEFMKQEIKSVNVNIEWHEDFERYKITGIVSN